jgi:hypothetical protein
VNKNKDRKKKRQNLAIIVMMSVLVLSRNLSNRGDLIFLSILFITYSFIILYLFIKRDLVAALRSLAIGIPIVLGCWGFYIDNEVIGFAGLGSFFVICLLIIVLDKLNLLG